MKCELTFTEWLSIWEDSGYKDNFSRYGLDKLFDYLEEMQEDGINFDGGDIVAIACEYNEYDSLEELQESYPNIKSEDDLRDNTSVICFEDDCIIIQAY